MESNGNGVLDHMTTSPVAAPISHQQQQHQSGTLALHGLYRSFQQLQAQRIESEQQFEQLMMLSLQTAEDLNRENDDLRTRLQECNLDLSDATRSRRELQQRVAHMNDRIGFMSETNEYLKNHNPYVVILIDGDGCHFQKRFVEQGIDGGKQAAYALRNAILKDYHNSTGPGSNVEVTARFIANLSGLSYITRASGTVDNEVTVRQFTSGFTQAMASFDFIDVGSGKERADTKIKEGIRWHLKNHNCKQIVVAISFDSGYASFLDEVLRDDDSRQRITLLEGPPSHRDLVAHRLRTVNLNDDILRSDKLEALYQTPTYVDRRLSNVTPVSITPPATIAGMSPLPPPPAVPSHSTPHSNGHQGPPPSSYAATAIKAASPPPQINLPIPLKNKVNKTAAIKLQPKAPLWNPGPRGLDAPLEVHQASLDNIKKRKDHNKLCNNHYLRGPCAKGDACCFEHNYRASESEKVAIAFLARQNPCTSGQDCEVGDCIYGHHCPSTNNGHCTHSYCKFKPWEHPPNTKFRQTYQFADEA